MFFLDKFQIIGGYVIFAGLEQIINYIQNLSFNDEDIEFLKSKNIFSNNFLNYLKDFKFTGDIWAVPEGSVIFPQEPLITVRAPIIEAQIIETMILLLINHQSLIATKSSRIVNAAKGRPVMEFGARRAHGIDAAFYGARAAIIGGCVGTSCTKTAKEYKVPASGTMAHSWIQSFDSEYEAFKAYADMYPSNCTLLVDTYNTLKSGIPNAIKIFDELQENNISCKKAIRLDSGDLAYLSKEARKMLDSTGHKDCLICGTNSLDEYLITSLIEEGAKIDLFGVGDNLITASSNPVFGGVYKISAIEENGIIEPKIKISDNISKIINPGFKKIYRFYDNTTNKALADVIFLNDETISTNAYTIFDPEQPWKKKTLTNYYVKPLQVQIFKRGELIYNLPNLKEIADYSKKELSTIWDEVKRIKNPHKYYVDLSQNLWDLKHKMLEELK